MSLEVGCRRTLPMYPRYALALRTSIGNLISATTLVFLLINFVLSSAKEQEESNLDFFRPWPFSFLFLFKKGFVKVKKGVGPPARLLSGRAAERYPRE